MKIFVAQILVALVREIEELPMDVANKATGIIILGSNMMKNLLLEIRFFSIPQDELDI
jgi:deoxyhypusine synthase